MRTYYSRAPLRRRKPAAPPTDVTHVYETDNEDKPGERIGSWKLNEPQIGGAFIPGVRVYNASGRLLTVAPNVGDAVMLLRAKRHNKLVAADFHEVFNE